MSELAHNYELSELEKKAIEEIKKHFTSKDHKFVFYNDGYGLVFANSKLTKLPNCIKNLKNLLVVEFSFNNTHEFPKILTEIPSLRKIILEGNKISKIPKEICNIKNLEMIYLSKNNFTEIPKEILTIRRLRELMLNENQIKKIPDWIGNLRYLTILNLRGNQIKDVLLNIEKLTELFEVDLFNNEIKKIKIISKSNQGIYLGCNYNLIEKFEDIDIDHDKISFSFYGNPIRSFHSVPKLSLKKLLSITMIDKDGYCDFYLSDTGQKLLLDLLDDDYFAHREHSEEIFLENLFHRVSENPIENNENEIEEEKVPYPQEKIERFYNFYKKPTEEILQALISKKSVSLEEMERLVHEGSINHRHLLENILSNDHPIFEMYNEEYSIRSESGLKIMM